MGSELPQTKQRNEHSCNITAGQKKKQKQKIYGRISRHSHRELHFATGMLLSPSLYSVMFLLVFLFLFLFALRHPICVGKMWRMGTLAGRYFSLTSRNERLVFTQKSINEKSSTWRVSFNDKVLVVMGEKKEPDAQGKHFQRGML